MGAASSVKKKEAACRFLDPAVNAPRYRTTLPCPGIPASVKSDSSAPASVTAQSRVPTQSLADIKLLKLSQAEEALAIASARETSGKFEMACDAYKVAADAFRDARNLTDSALAGADAQALKIKEVPPPPHFPSLHFFLRFGFVFNGTPLTAALLQISCLEKALLAQSNASKKIIPSPPPPPPLDAPSSCTPASLPPQSPETNMASQEIPQDMTDQ